MASVWDPIRIGSLTARNRIYLPAHYPAFQAEAYGLYIGERARGGAGVIVSTTLMAHPSAFGRAAAPLTPDSIPWLRQMVKPAMAHGALVFIQIGHTGPSWPPPTDDIDDWSPNWAPSAIQSAKHQYIPKVMEAGDIQGLIEGFVTVAANAQEAGASGVEIHAAHGYLLSSFLSPFWNRRTDGYGGNTENRARIVREIATAIRKKVGGSFVIGLRMNVDEYLDGKGTTPTEAMAVLDNIHGLGILNYVCLAHTDYHTNHFLVPPDSSGLVAPLASAGKLAKNTLRNEIPVLVHGSVRNIATAEDMITSGSADLVGMVRAHIADPHLVNKTKAGKVDEVHRCVGANQGCWRRLGRPISCTVNPVTGREGRYGIDMPRPVLPKQRVLVVGGGPGGMKYAATAAELGHDVTLWERDNDVGGSVRFAAQLPDYGMWNRLVEDLSGAIKRSGVALHLGKEATAEAVVQFGADLTVIATGARWDRSGFSTYRPATNGIAGLQEAGERILDPVTTLLNIDRCGKHVVIVDDNGDYLPLGLARRLQLSGRTVTVVTWDDAVGRKMHATNELPFLLPRVLEAGVKILVGNYVDRIDKNTVSLVGRWTAAQSSLPADTIILSMLRTANEELYLDLQQRGVKVARIGDCLAPREVDDAILEGFRLAMEGH